MSQPDNELRVIVSADTTRLSRGMSGAEQAVNQAERSMGAALGRIDRAFAQVDRTTAGVTARIGQFAAVLGIGGVATTLSDVATEAREFQTALAQVSTLLSDTSGLDRYATQLKGIAKQFGGLPIAQTKGLYEILSAGSYAAANAMDVLTQSNKLAIGGVTDVKTAADGLTSVLNAYGAAAGSATNVSDAFFAAAAAGKTDIAQLASYIGQVAPIAAQTGVSLDELMAAAAALTAGGIKTSTAMDGLRSVIAAVLKPSQEAAAASAAMGLQFNAAALKSKGLVGFLADVQAKTGGSADALALLFGGVEALLPVMALGGDTAGAFADALNELLHKAGATETAYNKMAGTAQKMADRLAAAASVYRIELGARLLAAAQPAMQGLVDNFDAVTSAAEQTAAVLLAALVGRGLGPLVAATTRAAVSQVQLAVAVSAGVTSYTTGARGAATLAAASLEAARAAAAETNATYLAAAANFEYSTSALAATRADIAHLQAQKASVTSTFAKLIIQREIMALRQIEAVQAATLAEAETALTAAATANTAAMTGAAGATATYGAALAGATLSARAAAAAMSMLRSALALVGGPMGAALLAGGAAAYYFASRTTEAEKATAAFESAQRAAADTMKNATPDAAALTKEYAGLSDSMRAVAALRLEEAIAKQRDALAALRKEASSAVYAPSSPFTVVEGNHGSDNLSEVYGYERLGLAADQVERLRTAVDTLRTAAKDDAGAIPTFVQVLENVGRAAGDAGKPLLDLARKLADPATKADQTAKTAKELESRLTLLRDPANEAARAILGIGKNAAQATGGLSGMESAVANITTALADMDRQIQQAKALEGAERAALAVLQQINDERKKADPSGTKSPPLTTVSPEYLQLLNKAKDLETARVQAQADAAAKVIDLSKRIAEAQAAGNVREAARLEKQKAAKEMEARGVAPTVAAAKAAQDYEISLAGIDAAAGQAAKQIDIAATAQERLAAAAGLGDAAMRRAAAANRLAEEAAKGNGNVAAVAAANRREEAAATLQAHNEFAGAIDAEVAANERLTAAYGVSGKAVEDATRYNEAYAQTLREVVPGENGWTEALDRNIAKLKERDLSRLTRDIAAYSLQMKQASEGLWVERAVAGMSGMAAIEAKARYEALRSLKLTIADYNQLDPAIRRSVDAQMDGAAALAHQQQEVQNYKSAWDTANSSLEKAFDRLGDSLVDAIVAGKGAVIDFGSIAKSIFASLLTDIAKLASVDLRRLIGLGGNAQGSLLDLFGGTSTSTTTSAAGQATGAGGSIAGSLTNYATNQAASWGANQLGFSPTSWLDSFGTSSLGIAPTVASSYVAPTVTLANGTTVAASPAVQASQMAMLGETSAAGAGGIGGTGIGLGGAAGGVLGAAGAGYLVGGMIGTATQSKTTGALSGAAAGAAYGTYILPGWGTAIGAVVGAIAGALGTAKTPAGPGAAIDYVYGADGETSYQTYTRKGEDDTKVKAISETTKSTLDLLRQTGGSLIGPISWHYGYNVRDGVGTDLNGRPFSEESDPDTWVRAVIRQLRSEGSLNFSDDAALTQRALDTALSNGDNKLEDVVKVVALSKSIIDGVSALKGVDKSFEALTKSAKEAAAAQYESVKAELDIAKKGGIESEYRDLVQRQLRAAFDPVEAITQNVSEWGAQVASTRGQFGALREAVAALGLSISETEIAAWEAAAVLKLQNSYSDSLTASLNSTQGRNYLNQADAVAAAVKTARGNINDLWAGDQGAIDAQWAKVVEINRLGAQKVIDDAGLVGDAYTELVASFTGALKNAGMAEADIAGLTAGLHESTAAREAATQAHEAATQAQEELQKRLLTAQVGAGAAAQAQLDAYATEVARRRELAATTDDATKAFLAQIYAAEDAASAVSKTAAAEKTRADLSLRLLEAQVAGGTATQAAYDAAKREADRKSELAAATDDATKALLRQVYAAQDLATASEAAKTSLEAERQARADAATLLERAYKAVGRDYRAAMVSMDQQQQAELRTAIAGGTTDIGLLLRTQAVERAQAGLTSLGSIIDKEIAARQAGVSAIRETVESTKALQKSLLQAADSFATDSSISPLAPKELLAEAKRQFEEASAKAYAGDTDAMGRVTDLGRTYIEADRAYNASASRTAYDAVQAVLRDLGTNGTATLDAQQALVTATDDQVKQLTALKQTADAALAAQQAVPVSIADLTTAVSGGIDKLVAANDNLASIISGKAASGDSNALMKAIFGDEPGNLQYGAPAGLKYTDANGSMSAGRFYALAYASGYEGDVGHGEITQRRATDPEFAARINSALDLYWQAQTAGLIGKIPGYEAGGVVGNGVWGKDSVIAQYAGGGAIALAGGEFVMPAAETAAYRPVLDAMRAGVWEPANAYWQRPANDRWVAPVMPRSGGGMLSTRDAAAEETRQLRAEVARLHRTIDRMASMLGDQGAKQIEVQEDIANSSRTAASGGKRKVLNVG